MTGYGPQALAVRIHQHRGRNDFRGLGVDGVAQAFQNVSEWSTTGDHFQGPFFRGQQRLGALSILDIGIRAIPSEIVAMIVAHGLCTKQEPAIFPVVPAQACFDLARLPGS